MKRVVVTGIGAITASGKNVTQIWDNIKNGNVAISELTSFDTEKLGVSVAAEIKDFDPLEYFDKKELRRTDRFLQLSMGAAVQAMEDTGTDFSDIDPYRAAVIFGSGIGGISSIEQEYRKFTEKGPNRVSVYLIPMMITNMAAGMISIKYNFCGSNYAPVTACATSTHAIGEAFRLIKHGYSDVCITGGSEAAITEFAMAGFKNMQALTYETDPKRASIPFSQDRSGFVMAEGSGALILEELEHALARGAKIYGEICGYGATADAYHITSPDPEGKGAAKAMELAFTEAGLSGADIDYINAHGTSTPLNDKYETIAIKKAFKENAKHIPISSTKSTTGHLLGAAGAIEAIFCLKAIEEQIIPPTVGLVTPDPECDLDYVPNEKREAKLSAVISNSLGFGGHNGTICIKKY